MLSTSPQHRIGRPAGVACRKGWVVGCGAIRRLRSAMKADRERWRRSRRRKGGGADWNLPGKRRRQKKGRMVTGNRANSDNGRRNSVIERAQAREHAHRGGVTQVIEEKCPGDAESRRGIRQTAKGRTEDGLGVAVCAVDPRAPLRIDCCCFPVWGRARAGEPRAKRKTRNIKGACGTVGWTRGRQSGDPGSNPTGGHFVKMVARALSRRRQKKG